MKPPAKLTPQGRYLARIGVGYYASPGYGIFYVVGAIDDDGTGYTITDGERAIHYTRGAIERRHLTVYHESIDPKDAADLYASAVEAEAVRQALRDHKEQRKADSRARHAANYPHLTPKASKPAWSSYRLAGENIRKELKRTFPGVKFSVTTDGSSVNVRWTDGPTEKAVKAVTGKYEMGSFDGMTDCYDYSEDNTFCDVFGGVRYVFESRSLSPETQQRAWAAKYPGGLSNGDYSVPAVLPENWNQVVHDHTLLVSISRALAEYAAA